MDIIERFIEHPELGKKEYEELLQASESSEGRERLKKEALRLRRLYYGDTVYVLSLIHIFRIRPIRERI